MSSAYGRPLSPPRNRYHPPTGPPGPRASAGSFFSTSAYDPYASNIRSSRDYVPAPRTSAERIGAPRVVPVRARSPPRRAPVDDYAVHPRPRRMTLEPDASRTRRPLSMIVPSTDPRRPIITSAIDRPPSPVMKIRREHRDDEYDLLPASSSSRRNHARHSSLGNTEAGRLLPLERDTRENTYRQSNSNRPAVRERQGENDRDYGFEYTDARESKHQDPTYRQRSRRDSYNGARPTNMGLAEVAYLPRSNRDAGPPVTTRGFENIERSENLRQVYRAKDDDRILRDFARDDRETGSRKSRPEIALHHPAEDGYAEEDSRHNYRTRKIAPEDEKLELRPRPRKEDEYSEPRARESHDEERDRGSDGRHRRHRHKRHRDHDRRRHEDDREDRDRRIRDEPRNKRDKDDDPRASSGMLAGAGAAAAAATGLVAEGKRRHRQKESYDDEGGRSVRRTREDEEEGRPSRRPRDYLREPERDPVETSSVSTGPSATEDREYDEARSEERRARHDAEAFIGPVGPALREQASYERRPEPDYTRHHRSYQPRRHHSRTRDADSYSSSSFSSSSDSEDDKIVRQPRVVTPSPEEQKKEPPPPPKGILRKPRDKFPEHPATEREGVAPHKDQVKKNVPPGARWTKIKRELVNPESLEQDGIRFNEFPDHVIVLKVMDAEEIMMYAKKTADIRAQRRMLMAPPPPEAVGSGAEIPPAPPVSHVNDDIGREGH